MAKIDELKFDDENFNDHTEFGMSLLEKSLQEFGAGRSILIDKNNNIIAGNGIVEAAAQAGIEDIKIIETTGDELVAVKRTDVELNSEKGRRMAFADNATSSVDLSWNQDNIEKHFDEGFVNNWGVELEKNFEEEKIEPELDFTEVLGEENNYIVLKFINEVDWLQALTVFGLEQKKDYYTADNHKIEQKGVGRVVDGIQAIKRLSVQ